jgi:hypothetical protein
MPVGDDDLAALGNKPFCYADADALRRPRDDRHLVLYPAGHGTCSPKDSFFFYC